MTYVDTLIMVKCIRYLCLIWNIYSIFKCLAIKDVVVYSRAAIYYLEKLFDCPYIPIFTDISLVYA